jgi:hypothetical protein
MVWIRRRRGMPRQSSTVRLDRGIQCARQCYRRPLRSEPPGAASIRTPRCVLAKAACRHRGAALRCEPPRATFTNARIVIRVAANTADRDGYRHLPARSYGFYAVVDPMASVGGELAGCLVWDMPEPGLSAGDWSRCAVGLDTNLPDAAVQDPPAATAATVSMFAAYEKWMSA